MLRLHVQSFTTAFHICTCSLELLEQVQLVAFGSTSTFATRFWIVNFTVIQIRSFMMMFFALIIMLRDRKLSSSVIFTLVTSMNLSGDQAFTSSAFHKELLRRHKQRWKFFKKAIKLTRIINKSRGNGALVNEPVLHHGQCFQVKRLSGNMGTRFVT